MDQTLERFHRVQSVFSLVVAAPESERLELLDTHCGSDSELEDEVRSMLDACTAEEQLNSSLRSQPGNGATDRPQPGRVGPYEIDRLLGRGGMGSVYLAHRADGHFEQQVAIKFIDLPIGSHLFRERLRQERQILATLQHPYIARLLNGGVTEEGWPYLAMEYVDGMPIQRFSAEHKLTEVERIELFLRVSDAVQFAHQNFVVHRDLKPDNILVVADGTPRLLDFGTAKLVSPSLSKRDSELTRAGYLTYTPQYASPEQVLGKPITAATDTYSLGVLLYLLLTGTLPYRLEELTTAEMLRVVCEEPPPRPCMPSGKRLNGDLEAILRKALRKEPQDRYPTVEQLAKDLRAYLDGHPVGARHGTLRYRASKFAHRHRLILASAVLLAATLAAGVAAVGWQAGVANRERRKAEARSADLRQLSNSLLTELDGAIQQIPGSTGAQRLLVTSVLKHLDRMAQDAHGDRQTQLDLADAYTLLGNLQGNAYQQNLGDTAAALVSIDKAIALSEPFAGSNSTDREALHALARAQVSRSQILFGTVPIQTTIASTQAAITTYNQLTALPDATPSELCDAASAYTVLGDELGTTIDSLNDLPGAISAYRKFLDLSNRALGVDPHFQRAEQNLIVGQVKIARAEMETNQEQALKDILLDLQRLAALPKTERESLRMQRIYSGMLLDEAYSLVELGRYSEANALLKDIVQSLQHFVTTDTQDLRALTDLHVGLNQEAYAFVTAADPALGASEQDRRRNLSAAERPLSQEISILEGLLKREPSQDKLKTFLADAQVRLGSIRFILHNGGDSTALVEKGLASWRELAGKDQVSPTILDEAAQDFLFAEPASLKDLHFAVSCSERAVDLSHRKLPSKLLTLAQAYRATGQLEKSRNAAQEGLGLLAPQSPGAPVPAIRKQLEAQLR
jgi:tetratricopeptide (TPR) repeat protein/predicted Ser/Thr protein kinase